MAYTKITGIYEIVHTASGRRYVGSAVCIKSRWGDHRRSLDNGRHHTKYFQRVWTKYGNEAFEFRILEACAADQLIVREQHHMDATPKNLKLNTAPAAGSPLGMKHGPEVGEAQRRHFKRLWSDPEYHAAAVEERHRRIDTPEKKAAWVGRIHSPEANEKKSRKALEREARPEFRKAKAERVRKFWQDNPGHATVMVAGVRRPTVRARIAANVKALWADPAYAAHQRAARMGRKNGVNKRKNRIAASRADLAASAPQGVESALTSGGVAVLHVPSPHSESV